jgi:ribosome-binding factor A
MPEDRQLKHRRERLADALRDEITTILEGELGDPRIGLATVTEVVLEGGRLARVYIAVHGTDEEAVETMKGIEAAKGFIRHEITEDLGRRRTPELVFHLDKSERHGGRIAELLGRIEKRGSKKRSAGKI